MSEKTKGLTASSNASSACEITWHDGTSEHAERIFNRVRKANLLQSLTYGYTIAKLNHQRVRRGIIHLDGREAGIVQTLEAGLFKNAIHAALIDRGPLWLEPYGTPEHFQEFVQALRTQYPKRLGRRIRFIPECKDNQYNREVLIKHGLRQTSQPYSTLWWDLAPSPEKLRTQLKSKWRGHLNKAERLNLKITWDETGQNLSWFMSGYEQDKRKRNYNGPSSQVLSALAQAFLQRKSALIGCATLDGEPLAGVLIFCHSKSATYQAGWTTLSGRESRAHHLLLWGAALKLKERDIYDFDLGGIEAEQEGGLKTFKEGTGGAIIQTPGLWI